MKLYVYILLFLVSISCKQNNTDSSFERKPISQSKTLVLETEVKDDLSAISSTDFREFKVLDSKVITKSDIWSVINPQLENFSESDYLSLKPLILESSITQLNTHIREKLFNYEQLTKFYLYRIRALDRENELSLNAVISINPKVIEQAKVLDATAHNKTHPIFGMPILLKDNINAKDMVTTAGALAMLNNYTEDSFLVKQLKSKGALILGKANLSEWAYYFCGDCPSGYSAVGGQTLNPYGRRILDTGGSSSGSGVSVAANFCAAAIGSETSGSILSPSSSNSVVGLKPTIGLVSRSGIVPISSTLDTAGPMTKTVMDCAIVLDAIYGYDTKDSKSFRVNKPAEYYSKNLNLATLKNKRFGVANQLLKDSLYVKAIKHLKANGAEIVAFDEVEVSLSGFLRLLDLDMKKDLPHYFANYASDSLALKSVKDVIAFNSKDPILSMPYGQKLFDAIAKETFNDSVLSQLKVALKTNGKLFFDKPMQAHNLDAMLSINNFHANYAAVAEYPAITVPIGYAENGKPTGLTFIATPLKEKQLLEWAYAFEQAYKARKIPEQYN